MFESLRHWVPGTLTSDAPLCARARLAGAEVLPWLWNLPPDEGFETLELDAQTQALFLHDNAERVFKLGDA